MAGNSTVGTLSPKKSKRGRFNQRKVAPYLFAAPSAIFFFVFFLFPVVFSGYIAFRRWDMLRPLSAAKFMGWKHFEFLFTREPKFLLSLKNTFVFSFGTVFSAIAISLILAFIFSRSRGKVIWRTIYWLPMVTNVVAISFLWRYIYDPEIGLLNVAILRPMGIVGPNWLDSPDWAMISIIIVSVWMGLGQRMLIFSAGLEGIDDIYYEASRIDGASTLQEFWYITLPLLRPTLMFVFITGLIGGLSSFALQLVMTAGGGPLNSTLVTAQYMYEVAFRDLRMGRASAAAYILFVIIFIITLIQLRIFRKGGVESY